MGVIFGLGSAYFFIKGNNAAATVLALWEISSQLWTRQLSREEKK
jgi:hypothetical protein